MPSSSLTCLNSVSKLHFLKNPLVSVTFQRPKNAKPSFPAVLVDVFPRPNSNTQRILPSMYHLKGEAKELPSYWGSYLTAAMVKTTTRVPYLAGRSWFSWRQVRISSFLAAFQDELPGRESSQDRPGKKNLPQKNTHLRKNRKERILEELGSWIWVFPKIGGKHPKMDGENNGKPY